MSPVLAVVLWILGAIAYLCMVGLVIWANEREWDREYR